MDSVRDWGQTLGILKATIIGLLFASIAPPARAQDEEPIYLDLRLMGADLVDEMVYTWTKSPPFNAMRGVVLADVSAPVGLDERFGVMVENRLYEVLQQNPGIPIALVHCSVCRQVVAKSTPKGTLLSRGIDQPEVLQSLLHSAPERLGLSMAFEAEGRELVLRAAIFELVGEQRILWAQTFATSLSARRVLREASPLVSLETARAQQNMLLHGKDSIEVTSRITLRQFNLNGGTGQAAPLLFLEQSIEGVPSPWRNYRAGFTLGFTSVRESLEAWSAGGHIMKLMFTKTPRLGLPDLYWFFGMHYIRMRGPGALVFGAQEIDVSRRINPTTEPKATLVTWRLGLETHMKYKLGFMAFLENIPLLKKNNTFQEEKFLLIPYYAWGAGTVIRW